jgi:hypothetical protein
MIKGSQCITIWHVDDLKIPHVQPEVVNSIIGKLSKVFGVEAVRTVHRGKVHEYLGMIISLLKKCKVVIKMDPYIKSILSEAQ